MAVVSLSLSLFLLKLNGEKSQGGSDFEKIPVAGGAGLGCPGWSPVDTNVPIKLETNGPPRQLQPALLPFCSPRRGVG